MKKAVRIFIILLIVNVILTGSVSMRDNNEVSGFVDRYQYPIDSSSDHWFDYTVLEKSEMLRIPQETLAEMSDLQLLYAIADYPYFCDAGIYGINDDGLAIFAKYCSAFNEFVSRKSFIESLNIYGKAVAQEYASKQSDSLNIARAEFILELLEYFNSSAGATRGTPIIVYTPNGTAVSALIETEPHTDEDEINVHFFWDQAIITQYGVVKVAPGSCIYNCHAYAWSWPSTSCPYWIPNPSNYMTDGSYFCAYSGSINNSVSAYGVCAGDIIYYPASGSLGSHSAILLGSTSGGVSIGSVEAISKWGNRGIFRHAVGNVSVQYQSSYISIWKD